MSVCSEARDERGISADSSRLTSNISFAGFGTKIIKFIYIFCCLIVTTNFSKCQNVHPLEIVSILIYFIFNNGSLVENRSKFEKKINRTY